MDVKKRQRIERQIVRKFVKVALADGCAISLHNGGDDFEFPPTKSLEFILDRMFATDDEYLKVFKDGKPIGWVYFVYGNDGYDVIVDYSTALEYLMPEVQKPSDDLEPLCR
jgi:hypothetical protein